MQLKKIAHIMKLSKGGIGFFLYHRGERFGHESLSGGGEILALFEIDFGVLGEGELCYCVRGGGHCCEKANPVSDF
jgi:hypothetical protein